MYDGEVEYSRLEVEYSRLEVEYSRLEIKYSRERGGKENSIGAELYSRILLKVSSSNLY
ncbi:24199_t:CDS:1, partial [Gigaspora rosea]